jgi:membrane dipeptidase
MPWMIDAHEDIAYNALTFGRDLRLSAAEVREKEKGAIPVSQTGGETTVGWPDYQIGQVALIFGTLFAAPAKYSTGAWDFLTYATPQDSHNIYQKQLDYYDQLCDENPHMYRRVTTRANLDEVTSPWKASAAAYPERTHPVGLVTLLEGPEGIGSPGDIEPLWERGVRAIGPVWAGTRWCGGSSEGDGFTKEGITLLETMGAMGFGLDVSHMNEKSSLTALDRYEGVVFASHANARAMLKGATGERHLTDASLEKLIEREGVLGVIPYNGFLKPGWKLGDPREEVTLDTLAAHIDHVCQLAGNARHAAIGTDLDGGFGWPAIPLELDTIADLQKLELTLAARGFSDEDIRLVFHGNWLRILERLLPA